MSTYTTNTPLSTDKIKNTTSLIRANFDNLAAGLSNDHADINDPTSGTRLTHDKVRLNVQGAAPSTTATQIALYSKNVLASAVNYPELFLRRANNGTEIQLTIGGLDPVGSGVNPTTQGYTFLFGKFLLIWGRFDFISDQVQTLPNPSGRLISKIWMCTIQPRYQGDPESTGAMVCQMEQIDNTVVTPTIKPYFIKTNGKRIDAPNTVPSFYQAIVELAP